MKYLYLLWVVTLAVAALLLIRAAHARDPGGIYANSPYHEWYGKQHNKEGQWCCDKSDGHDYYGDVKMLSDGSVELDGNIKVEATKVLTGPNPTGHGVWWYVTISGKPYTYCFALPSMG